MTVSDWLIKSENTVLGQVMSMMHKLEQNKVVSKALDGTVYIQTVGYPTKVAEVSVLCDDEQVQLLNMAEAAGSYLSVHYLGKTYYGYISASPKWKVSVPWELYIATFDLLIQEETA